MKLLRQNTLARSLNYGLLIILLWFLIVPIPGFGQQEKGSVNKQKAGYIKNLVDSLIPKGYVSDFEQVLTLDEVSILDSIILQHDKKVQVAIVTLNIDTSLVRSIDDYKELSLGLFNRWGVGEKGKDNGIGIMLSTNARMVRIEVGKGLETIFIDSEAQRIIDETILPHFIKGRIYEGLLIGLKEIYTVIH